MIEPQTLKRGDRVAIVAPARKVTPAEVEPFAKMLENKGFSVVLPDGLFAADNQLGGSDEHRAQVLQQQLDDPDIRAIVCARGGYGTVRIIDRLNFSRFAENPKWIVGYSDATVLHAHLNRLGFCTLHATMPIDIASEKDFGSDAATTLIDALTGHPHNYQFAPNTLNHAGSAEAEVVGGNLSILYSLIGTPSMPDTNGRILLIEDLDEYLYHIDRMMTALRRSGALDGLKGLIVGALSDMHDNAVPFGLTADEIVRRAVDGLGFPVAFGAPIGHIKTGNCALVLGKKIRLEASNSEKSCIFAF
ncbi:MAG: LD-carboxypeptidase [Bacteroidales bacterium]|nr:LD-carboxypeptidase [Bacteroidales bacterium]